MNQDEQFKNVISHAKEYGFVFQSSEIYDGLSAVYDYGQLGAELKNNIKSIIGGRVWCKCTKTLSVSILLFSCTPTTWKASGHVDAFSDPLIGQ